MKESKKQTVRVVVQSDRDMNDPAVKMTILNKVSVPLVIMEQFHRHSPHLSKAARHGDFNNGDG